MAGVEEASLAEGDRAQLTITNVDHVVRARESHRVMRAYFGQYFLAYLGLSCLVTVLLFLTLARTYSDSGATGFQFAIEPLRFAIGMMLFASAAAVILIVLSWFQFLPRQLAMLWPGLVGPLAALTNAFALFSFIGPLAASLEETFGFALAQLLASVLAGGLAAAALVIGVSWSINAWRLIWTPRDDFLVARGWKPNRYSLGGSIRRMLGVPSYASSLARSRTTVLALFVLASALGGGAALFPLLAPAWMLGALNWSALRIDPYDPASGGVFLAGAFGYILGPFILFAVLALLGRLVTRAAQRIAASNYQSIRDWDDRPPILYLRSFAIDNRALRVPPRGVIARLIGLGAGFATLDETVLDCAAPYGPVIAIGDPRDPIPPLGAARNFVRGDDWQSVVSDLARAAKLIVLTTDTSEGVKWEITHVLSEPGLRDKTIFLTSPMGSGNVMAEIARALGAQTQPPADTISLSTARSGGVVALSAPTLSSDSYAAALNHRLQRDFGLDVDFPLAPQAGSRALRTGIAVAAVASAGAAAAFMLALNPHLFSERIMHVADAAAEESRDDEFAVSDPPPMIEPPWIERPGAEDVALLYPALASERYQNGRVLLNCVVGEDHHLGCQIEAEEPRGWGFADAALQLSRIFVAAPSFLDGTPTQGARVRIGCTFQLGVCEFDPLDPFEQGQLAMPPAQAAE